MFSQKTKVLGALLLLIVASCSTYLPAFHEPAAFFWDENFHIPNAQRYLHGIFFMEPHPPLGKLLIAAGEWLVDANRNDATFISVEHAEDLPEGFSFTGYRLFPVLCGTLLGPMLFLLIYRLSNSISLSALTGMLPIFDNALIVHSRGAMLDPPLLLAIVTGVLFYHLSLEELPHIRKWCVLFGIACGAALSIKMNGAILLLFATHLLILHRCSFYTLLAVLVPAISTFIAVWSIHFTLGATIDQKLPDQGLFEVSDEFAQKVRTGESRSILSLLDGITEAAAFTKRYQRGVPQLDYCKDDENGSSPILWPIGSRTINYRWETLGELTRYLYLVPNPFSWTIGILGVLTSLLRVLIFSGAPIRGDQKKVFITLLLCAYFISWLSPYLIPRVFYLYHYFIPLLFSWILFGAFAAHFQSFASTFSHLILALGVTGSYVWFSPLTYYLPLSHQELELRALIFPWDLRHQSTPSNFHSYCSESLAERRRISKDWQLVIGDLSSNYIEQGVGSPQQYPDGFSVTTNSRIQFPLNKKYSILRGRVTSLKGTLNSPATVEIKLDGESVWKRSLSSLEEEVEVFEVPTLAASVLCIESKSERPGGDPVTLRWKRLEIIPHD